MRKLKLLTALVLIIALVGACAAPAAEEPVTTDNTTVDAPETEAATDKEEVVNLYTDRHYDTDAALYELFTAETGIKVNVVKAKSDELIERLNREGASTEADLLITADAGRLYRANELDLLQAVESDILEANVPEKYQDVDNNWFGLTKRARVIVYMPEETDVAELSTYEALTEEKWQGEILIRSSENIYNQSLMAAMIEVNGEEAALTWAKGMVGNMARVPAGNDRDQAKAVVAGEGSLAIMNTYYIGKMLNSSDPEEVKVGEQVAVFFPNQETTGTHINISGVGMTKHAKNVENAKKLMEFLTGEAAQYEFANANYEYPVNPAVDPSPLLASWGSFKEQDINLTKLGENNTRAVQLFLEAGWQ